MEGDRVMTPAPIGHRAAARHAPSARDRPTDTNRYSWYGCAPDRSTGSAIAARHRRRHDTSAAGWRPHRSAEHTSELQSLMRNSYAVFCLTQKKIDKCRIYVLSTILSKDLDSKFI